MKALIVLIIAIVFISCSKSEETTTCQKYTKIDTYTYVSGFYIIETEIDTTSFTTSMDNALLIDGSFKFQLDSTDQGILTKGTTIIYDCECE